MEYKGVCDKHMEADIRLIRLLRKAVAEKQDESEVSDSRQSYFATDYFDILQADEKHCKTLLQKSWI